MKTSNFYTNFELDWDHILLSYYEDGKKFNKKIKLKPSLYVPSALDNAEYTSFDGKPVMRVDFDSVKEARNFVRSYEGSNFKIYGLPHFHYVYIYENFKNIQFDRDLLKILNLDIETDNIGGYPKHNLADKEINLITSKLMWSKDIYTFGIGPYKQSEEPEIIKLQEAGYKIHYKECKNEKELLSCFIKLWKHLEPDATTGWNIRLFDIPYIIKRIIYNFGENAVKELSPFGKIKADVITLFNKENDVFDIVGIPTMDYMDIYKKFFFGNEESYSLNYLSAKILNATKLDYSEYGSLAKLQEQNWQKYADYNIVDVIRVEQIDNAINYIDVAFEIAYETKTNYMDSMTTIRVWDAMIHGYLMDRKHVVPFSSENRKDRSIAGGFVKEPQIGKHKWVMSFDFKSLYPHLCMTFNISPDTFLGTLKTIYGATSVEKILNGELKPDFDQLIKNNVAIAGNGAVFTRKKEGFIPAIMQHLFDLRAKHQKEEDKYTKQAVEEKDKKAKRLATIFYNKSFAIKILLNGGYGALSNEFYRFFHNDIAESFTLSGQLSIKTVTNYVNDKLNTLLETKDIDYVVAIDTDSGYFKLDDVVDKFCDKDPVDFLEEFSDTMQTWIKESLEILYAETNAFKKKLSMSLESIGPAIWVAKKRYVMSLPSYKKIRYNPPKIKIMGIEAVRSSTPQIARKWITDAIPHALADEEAYLKKFIDDKWGEFTASPMSSVAMPRGVNDLEKYADKQQVYTKGCPLHVRGSLLYNDWIRKNNLENDIRMIVSGDKVKISYLKLPNPLMENVICIPEELPKEFEFLIPFIDYEKQFDKVFLDPLKRITNAAQIKLSTNIEMDSFYG